MASKSLLLCGFFLAALVLLSSQVAARDLAEKSDDASATQGVGEELYWGRPRYGHGGHGWHGGHGPHEDAGDAAEDHYWPRYGHGHRHGGHGWLGADGPQEDAGDAVENYYTGGYHRRRPGSGWRVADGAQEDAGDAVEDLYWRRPRYGHGGHGGHGPRDAEAQTKP